MMDGPLADLQQAVVFSRDPLAVETIRQSLDSFASFETVIEAGNIASAVQQSDRLQSARIVIVDIRGEEDPFVTFTKLVDLCPPSTRLIVIGDINDIRFYRSLRRAGAAEYFFVPLMRELFVQALKEALSGRTDLQAQRSGRLIVTVGLRGGCGATTVALRTAALLSEDPPRPVFFLDLDLKSGDAALQMDLKPSGALREAMAYPDDVDELFIERTGLRASANLSLMAALDGLSDPDRIDEGAILTLLSGLLRRYRYVVVDVPRWVMSRLPRMAELPGTIVLVTDGRIASAREVARWREWLGGQTDERAVIHVLNMSNAPNAFPLEPFSLLAGAPPDILVPYFREAAAASVAGPQGASGYRKLDESLGSLVSKLTGSAVAARRSEARGLRRLLGRR